MYCIVLYCIIATEENSMEPRFVQIHQYTSVKINIFQSFMQTAAHPIL